MPMTPSDSPSAPAQYAAVAVTGQNIQAPQADLSAAVAAAVAAANGPRQAQSDALLTDSDEMNVSAGYSGGGGESWTSDPRP